MSDPDINPLLVAFFHTPATQALLARIEELERRLAETRERVDEIYFGRVKGCRHSAQDWYLKDGQMGCEECDDDLRRGQEEADHRGLP